MSVVFFFDFISTVALYCLILKVLETLWKVVAQSVTEYPILEQFLCNFGKQPLARLQVFQPQRRQVSPALSLLSRRQWVTSPVALLGQCYSYPCSPSTDLYFPLQRTIEWISCYVAPFCLHYPKQYLSQNFFLWQIWMHYNMYDLTKLCNILPCRLV